MNLSQARSQVVTVWGYLTPMSDSEKEVGQSLPGGLLVRGGVNGLESGRDLPAVPVGDEPHPGARNRVDHAGGDRGLGPGRLDRLGKAGEPVAFPRALRSRAGGAPSTIRHAPTLRLCRHGRTQAALQGGSLLGPGPQILKPRA